MGEQVALNLNPLKTQKCQRWELFMSAFDLISFIVCCCFFKLKGNQQNFKPNIACIFNIESMLL